MAATGIVGVAIARHWSGRQRRTTSSMDRTWGERKLRMLCVVDAFTRAGLAIELALRPDGQSGLAILTDLMMARGMPDHVGSKLPTRCATGSSYHWRRPTCAAIAVRERIAKVGARTLCTGPGGPTPIGYTECSDGSLREERRNVELFDNLGDAKVPIERWRLHFNTDRPHASPGPRPQRQSPRRTWPPPCTGSGQISFPSEATR